MRSNTSTKLASVGGLGMNTGTKDMLSTSFFSDSDSIHKNTRIAGETSANTDNPKNTRPTSRRTW